MPDFIYQLPNGQWRVKAGTTLKQLAQFLGISGAELKRLNPQWVENGRLAGGSFSGEVELRQVDMAKYQTDAAQGNWEGLAGSVPFVDANGDGINDIVGPSGEPLTPTGGTAPDQPFIPIDTIDLADMPVEDGGLPPVVPPGTAKMAFEMFAAYARLAGIEDMAMLQEIYNAAGLYLENGVDAGAILDIIANEGSSPLFNKYLTDFNVIKKTALGINTIAEWNQAKQEYKNILTQLDPAYATDENANKFLSNGVSATEAAERLNTAYNAVLYADQALKDQLKTYFPTLTGKDLVATILGVGNTVGELQQKIGVSGIRAEAATAGVAGRIGAEELYRQGVTRQAARQGYQTVAAATPGFEAAAARAQESPADVQTMLEQENLLGLRSKRRAQLAAREQSYLAGQAGTATGSLGRQVSGAF